MQVIFLQAVGGVRRDTMKEVSDGYALNFLFPRGLAVRATPEKLTALAQRSQTDVVVQAKALGVARSQASELASKVVTIRAKASSAGTLYATLAREAVATAITEQLKVPVSAKQLQPIDQLKSVGDHVVAVEFNPEAVARLTVHIEAA